MEKVATEDTKLIYMTTGVLLQKIVSAKSLVEFTHVFIDEVSALLSRPASVCGAGAVQVACKVSGSSSSLHRAVLLLEVDLLFSSSALTSKTWVRRLRKVQRLLV